MSVDKTALAKQNREALASLNEDADIVEWAPRFKDDAEGRKPWPALIKQWAEHGVTVEGPDECGLYAYTRQGGGTMYGFNLSAPAKSRGPSALVPALTTSGEPSLFKNFKRSKVRDLTRAELDALHDDQIWHSDLEKDGHAERLPNGQYAVRFGERIYIFAALACRPWRPAEIAEREAKYRKEDEEFAAQYPGDDRFDAIPWHKPHEHSAPMASASVIVTDLRCKAGALYIETETEEETPDVYDIFA
jgi:hypothetical protein